MTQQIAQNFQSLKTHRTSWKKKIVAIVERILKRKKFFKSLSRDIDKISNMLRLENVAESEDLAFRKWIKNVSSKKTTFNASFLKCRIVLFILQQSDSFAQRVRLRLGMIRVSNQTDRFDYDFWSQSNRIKSTENQIIEIPVRFGFCRSETDWNRRKKSTYKDVEMHR